MYIREDQVTSAKGVLVDTPIDMLNISEEAKKKIRDSYAEIVLKNCTEFTRSVYFEGDHIRTVTRLSYPTIEQFDEDLNTYRKFFFDTAGVSIMEMLESNGYKNQLLYEDIV